ncbi:MAG: reverse transcriptase-like protein [Candidatus Marsarchaeota archaeon]|jgi:ribonuclease HI|nr:reverse transcriptase-like protein [Candidatus Marsarchaeota archaeon]
MLIHAYTDGASRSNPGKSASGYALFEAGERMLYAKVFFNGIRTNNVAEYIAFIAAMEKIEELYGHDNEVHAFTDSMVMAKQITSEYKTKAPALRTFNLKAKMVARMFNSFTITHVSRRNSRIAAVDYELNKLLDYVENAGTLPGDEYRYDPAARKPRR